MLSTRLLFWRSARLARLFLLDILPTSRLGFARAVAFDGVLSFCFRGLPFALVLYLGIFVDLPLLFCIFLWLLRTPFLFCLLL